MNQPTLTPETVCRALEQVLPDGETLQVHRLAELDPGLALVHYEYRGKRGGFLVADNARYDLAELPLKVLPPTLTGECQGLLVFEDGRFVIAVTADRLLLVFRLAYDAQAIVTALQDYLNYRRVVTGAMTRNGLPA
jgi:hypothetical protein